MFIFPRGLLLLACLVAVPCTHANEESVMPTSETTHHCPLWLPSTPIP
jgi:oligopeptidase B